MATIELTELVQPSSRGRSVLSQWLAMGNADTGAPLERHEFVDRSVQIDGTLGGATIVIEGSNDGVSYYTLYDLQGDALSFTGAALKGIAEPTRYIRPVTSGGSGSSINVYVFGKLVA